MHPAHHESALVAFFRRHGLVAPHTECDGLIERHGLVLAMGFAMREAHFRATPAEGGAFALGNHVFSAQDSLAADREAHRFAQMVAEVADTRRLAQPVARQMFGLPFEDSLRQLMAEIERRHDAAIYAAAGLNPPSEAEEAFVKRCDITALVTERRDFLSPPPMPWAPSIEAVPPLPSRQRLLPPAAASVELHALFLSHLPGARAQSARAAPITQRSA